MMETVPQCFVHAAYKVNGAACCVQAVSEAAPAGAVSLRIHPGLRVFSCIGRFRLCGLDLLITRPPRTQDAVQVIICLKMSVATESFNAEKSALKTMNRYFRL
jgi:hypothetical protein